MIRTNTALTIRSKITCIHIVMEGRSYCYPSQPLVKIQKFHPSVPVQHTGSRQKICFDFMFMQVQFQRYCPKELYQFLFENAITIFFHSTDTLKCHGSSMSAEYMLWIFPLPSSRSSTPSSVIPSAFPKIVSVRVDALISFPNETA